MSPTVGQRDHVPFSVVAHELRRRDRGSQPGSPRRAGRRCRPCPGAPASAPGRRRPRTPRAPPRRGSRRRPRRRCGCPRRRARPNQSPAARSAAASGGGECLASALADTRRRPPGQHRQAGEQQPGTRTRVPAEPGVATVHRVELAERRGIVEREAPRDHREPRDALGEPRRDPDRVLAPEGPAHHRDAIELQRVEQLADVVGEVGGGSARGTIAEADPRAVGRDHARAELPQVVVARARRRTGTATRRGS